MDSPVVISGMGLVTPWGSGKDKLAQNLFQGNSGISPISAFDTAGFSSKLGAQITDFTPRDFITVKNLRRMDRLSSIAVAASRMAVEDARITFADVDPDRVGVILGTAFGGTDTAAQFAHTLFGEGPRMASPLLVPNTVMNAPAGHAAIELGVRGPNTTLTHYEASAEMAIAHAAAEVRRGRADIMLAGGADILSSFFFRVLTRFGLLSPLSKAEEAPRPFDQNRNGLVAGEGAGVVCLETMAHARRRGVTPYCTIEGWGMSSQPTAPVGWPENGEGMKLAIRRSLAAARIAPADVDFVSASANGGRCLDRLEADALQDIFPTGKHRPPISSVKGAMGESFSSGGIRVAVAALCLNSNRVPPTLNLKAPIAPLRFVTDSTVNTPLQTGLVNGFSSGGTFACLVLKAADSHPAS